jgi:hypothetical protein
VLQPFPCALQANVAHDTDAVWHAPLPLQVPPLSVVPLHTGDPHRPRGSIRPDVTGRHEPLVEPVSADRQLWHEAEHGESQQTPSTQFIELQSLEV